jgi:hypothetical protein
MILRAWKAVSLPILEAKAYLESIRERLDRKVIAHAVKLVSLPDTHPARNTLPYVPNVCRHPSPLSVVYRAAKKRLKPEGVGSPIGSPPWIQPL